MPIEQLHLFALSLYWYWIQTGVQESLQKGNENEFDRTDVWQTEKKNTSIMKYFYGGWIISFGVGGVLCKIPIFTFSNIPDDNPQNCVFVVQHLSWQQPLHEKLCDICRGRCAERTMSLITRLY